jgi:hypothetical protein
VSESERWLRMPPRCPAATEDGRSCLLGVRHRGAHAWDGNEVDALRHQLEGAVNRIDMLEKALDLAASDLRSEGHYEMSNRAYAPLEDERGQ